MTAALAALDVGRMRFEICGTTRQFAKTFSKLGSVHSFPIYTDGPMARLLAEASIQGSARMTVSKASPQIKLAAPHLSELRDCECELADQLSKMLDCIDPGSRLEFLAKGIPGDSGQIVVVLLRIEVAESPEHHVPAEIEDLMDALVSVIPIAAYKASVARGEAYRRMAQISYHTDNGFSDTVVWLCQELKNGKRVDSSEIDLLLRRAETRKWINWCLIGDDPVSAIDAAKLYMTPSTHPALASGDRVSYSLAGSIATSVRDVEAFLTRKGWGPFSIELRFSSDERAIDSSRLGTHVLDACVRELIKNAVRQGNETDPDTPTTVTIDFAMRAASDLQCTAPTDIELAKAKYLVVQATDDAGGAFPADFPLRCGIDPGRWLDYAMTNRKLSGGSRGNGVLMMSRFATSTGGSLWADQVAGGAVWTIVFGCADGS